jgi:hypothetical protein
MKRNRYRAALVAIVTTAVVGWAGAGAATAAGDGTDSSKWDSAPLSSKWDSAPLSSKWD